MKKLVLALGLLAAAAPAFAQTPGGMVMPIVVPPVVNTTQPPVPTPPAEAPKN